MPREWITWHGGECPVPPGTRVDVRHRNGLTFNDEPAGREGVYARAWDHDNSPGDIVAWRRHQPEPKECAMIDLTTTPIEYFFEHMPPVERYVALYQKLPALFRSLINDGDLKRKDMGWNLSYTGSSTSLLSGLHVEGLSKRGKSRIRETLGERDKCDELFLPVSMFSSSAVFPVPYHWEYLAAIQPYLRELRVILSPQRTYAVVDNWCNLSEAGYLQWQMDYGPIPSLHRMDVFTLLECAQRGEHPSFLAIISNTTYVCEGELSSLRLRIDRPLWQIREHMRLVDGTYVELPETIAKRIPRAIFDAEIPHMAIKGVNKGKIAYTESPAKGAKDVQTVAKPGRYLRRVLDDLESDQELKEMVADLAAAADIEVRLIHNDMEVFRRVYMEGPSSCMAYDEDKFRATYDEYGDWRHPVEAYCHPDNNIALAYVEVDGRPAARVLVNTETMGHVTIYASDWAPIARTVLIDWLKEEGYKSNDNALIGEKLARIDLKNGAVLCPYIDSGGIHVDIHDDHLIIDLNGSYSAPHDWGYAHPDDIGPNRDHYCESCDDYYDGDDITSVNGGNRQVCSSCLDDYEVAIGYDGYLEHYHYDDIIEMPCRVTHVYTHQSADYIHRSVDLSDVGMVRDIDGEIQDLDGCYRTPDGDYVQCDDVWDVDNDIAFTSVYDYVLVDGEAHETDDCFFYEDEGMWCLREDYDMESLVQVDNYRYRDAEDEDVAEDEDAAEVA